MPHIYWSATTNIKKILLITMNNLDLIKALLVMFKIRVVIISILVCFFISSSALARQEIRKVQHDKEHVSATQPKTTNYDRLHHSLRPSDWAP